MDRMIFSVHQINEYVRGLLGRDPILQDVWVRGEISNLKIHSSGHIYFTLKDEQDRIRCVFFRQNQRELTFIPEDGIRVLVRGQVSLYCKDGQYQIYVMSIERDGIGELYLAFEALKQRLKAEGLFDAQYKKPIPAFPRKIAVITSPTGAAVRDIIKVTRRRCPCVDILVVPVLVQGSAAPAQIAAALDYVNTRDDVDTIILGRGGGSLEELWAFNEEVVARAIWRSRIPVISAVGHETDFTIADFVADLRAPTPSAAAEMAVPMLGHLQEVLYGLNARLVEAMRNVLLHKRKAFEHLRMSYVFRYPDRILQQRRQRMDQAYARLCTAFDDVFSSKRERLSRLAAALDALSPLAVLGRGYAFVTLKPDRKTVCSIESLKRGDDITVHFRDGRAHCKVEEIESGVYEAR